MMKPVTDRVLKAITDPLNGEDQLLFARAYREHFPSLMSFVRRRVGSDAEAADIVQEAYLRVLRYRHRPELAELKSLLFQIVFNLLGERTRLARSQHRAGHIPLETDLPLASADPSQDEQVAAQQGFERLMAAVDRLPRRCRQVFVMRRFQGMDQRQIAERLGISVKAVERQITKAIATCRKKVGGEWP